MLMSYFRVKFGHPNSIGIAVEAGSKKEATATATDVLLVNRGQRNYVTEWEAANDSKVHPSISDFGAFPKVISVEEE